MRIYYGKEASEFSKKRGHWLLANVEQDIGWPQKKVLVIYETKKILLLPAGKKIHPAAAFILHNGNIKEGKTFMMQFLSALAWNEQGKIDILEWSNSSPLGVLSHHLRLPLARQAGITAVFFKPTDLPTPKDPKARQALAFFREGMSLNHLGYSFLSYYKIINMIYPNGQKQKSGFVIICLLLKK